MGFFRLDISEPTVTNLNDIHDEFGKKNKLTNSLGFAGYITVCVQLYCVSCHCLTLYVSAYMAIFMCVVYFYFHMP
jgi:hypothetical protein